MRKIVLGLGILICLFSGCLKSNKNNECGYSEPAIVAPANEVTDVQNYLTTNSITATQHSSGLFYTINSQGSGQSIVNLCSIVSTKYTGKLTNGSVFDSSGNNIVPFELGQLIVGWQKGLPLISKGGKITLYIPPTLGYGSNDVKNSAGVVIIPKNSIIIFEIELIDIN